MSGRYIIPLDLGDHVAQVNSVYLKKVLGEKDPSKRVAAYIGGGKKKIVVDTGPPSLEHTLKYHPHPQSKPEPRKPEQEMEVQLAKAGVKPEEIDIVVLTHLHWDHVGDVASFRKRNLLYPRWS